MPCRRSRSAPRSSQMHKSTLDAPLRSAASRPDEKVVGGGHRALHAPSGRRRGRGRARGRLPTRCRIGSTRKIASSNTTSPADTTAARATAIERAVRLTDGSFPWRASSCNLTGNATRCRRSSFTAGARGPVRCRFAPAPAETGSPCSAADRLCWQDSHDTRYRPVCGRRCSAAAFTLDRPGGSSRHRNQLRCRPSSS